MPTDRTRSSSPPATTRRASTPGRPTIARSCSIRCATNRSTADRATSTPLPRRAERCKKSHSPLPANGGVFFGNDGQRVYFLSGDVKDAAEQPALVSAKPRRIGSARHRGANAVGWGDTLLADMKEGGGLCGWPLPDGKRAAAQRRRPGLLQSADAWILASGSFRHGHAAQRRSVVVLDFARRKPRRVSVQRFHASGRRLRRRRLAAARRGSLRTSTRAYLASVTLSQPQEFTVKDPAGFTVQAWFMPATGRRGERPSIRRCSTFTAAPKRSSATRSFTSFSSTRRMGYNVVFCDPAGSTGHGYAFEESLESNYGDAMFQDVQAVMDAAVRRPDVDATRLGVLGGSYGGYATLWVIAHTDRYKAAVAERAVSNVQSENLAADFAGKNGLGGGYYTWGPPWDPASTDYAKFSPLTYVANVRTPLLILHADDDTRAPIDQTLQEYTALKILGARPSSTSRCRTRTTTCRAPARRSTASSACTSSSTGCSGTFDAALGVTGGVEGRRAVRIHASRYGRACRLLVCACWRSAPTAAAADLPHRHAAALRASCTTTSRRRSA